MVPCTVQPIVLLPSWVLPLSQRQARPLSGTLVRYLAGLFLRRALCNQKGEARPVDWAGLLVTFADVTASASASTK